MKPSAKQLLEGIDWSLQNRVAPVTDDQWAASTLRSVHCLLAHLAVRVHLEGQLLFEDNADAREVLATARDHLGLQAPSKREQIDHVLGRRWRADSTYPTVASMTEENDALRTVVDELLIWLHDASDSLVTTTRADMLAELDAYVRRRLARDQPMFMPAFTSSAF